MNIGLNMGINIFKKRSENIEHKASHTEYNIKYKERSNIYIRIMFLNLHHSMILQYHQFFSILL
jgi:hypothetical protein